MMIQDIGHAAFAANDLATSIAFYARLGIEEVFRLYHDDGRLMLVYLHVAGDRFIEIFPDGPEPERGRRQSYMHLCLVVEDLQATVEELEAEGIPIDHSPKLGVDGNWQAWIHDPDGNAIELMQLSEDSPQRRVARSEPVNQ